MSMIARFKFGLRWKLNVLIGTVLVVTMVIFEGMSLHHERELLLSARAHHLQELAQHFGWVVQRADGQNQQNLVMDYERALNGNENHDYRALILNAHSQVTAATGPELMGTVISERSLLESYETIPGDTPTQTYVKGTSRMLAALPISIRSADARSEDRFLTILISGSLDDIRAGLNTSASAHALHLLITALAMITVINLALSRFVLGPIQSLLADMNRMQRGEWTNDVPVKSNDQIGELTRGYNALGDSLQASVNRLVKAEKLSSVALVAIHLNRGLKNPIERIRESAKFLSRRNAFDADSAHAVGRIFDETEKIYAISEKFNENFSTYFGDVTARQTDAANLEPGSQESRLVYEPTREHATTPD